METVPFMMSYKGPPEGGRNHKKEKNQPLSMEAFNTTWYPCLETEL